MRKEEFWDFWFPVLTATVVMTVYALMPYWLYV